MLLQYRYPGNQINTTQRIGTGLLKRIHQSPSHVMFNVGGSSIKISSDPHCLRPVCVIKRVNRNQQKNCSKCTTLCWARWPTSTFQLRKLHPVASSSPPGWTPSAVNYGVTRAESLSTEGMCLLERTTNRPCVTAKEIMGTRCLLSTVRLNPDNWSETSRLHRISSISSSQWRRTFVKTQGTDLPWHFSLQPRPEWRTASSTRRRTSLQP